MSIEAVKNWLRPCAIVPVTPDAVRKLVDALRQAIEQAEQEPIAWMYVNTDGECEQIEYGKPFDDPSVTPLYTAPPPRQPWVELTDEEKQELYDAWIKIDDGWGSFYALIEAKIKEKNT